MIYKGLTSKYLPLIESPEYASFQMLETLTVCNACNYYGVSDKDMIPKEAFKMPRRSEFWTEAEVETIKEKK